jgi:hypothetical protein
MQIRFNYQAKFETVIQLSQMELALGIIVFDLYNKTNGVVLSKVDFHFLVGDTLENSYRVAFHT